jgi:hypothetical protein
MRWSDGRITDWLTANTQARDRWVGRTAEPRFGDLVRWHGARGGFWDHLLAFWLVMPTFGLSAWAWRRWRGSCVFAGFLEPGSRRVGCLIHPQQAGAWGTETPGRDLRRHAFPGIPTLGCNRNLRCRRLDDPTTAWTDGFLDASRKGAASLRATASLAARWRKRG